MWCRSSLRFYGCRLQTFNISNKWDCDVNYTCHVLSTTVPCKPWTGRLISLSAESNYWQLFWKLLLFISANRRKKYFFFKIKKIHGLLCTAFLSCTGEKGTDMNRTYYKWRVNSHYVYINFNSSIIFPIQSSLQSS